MLGKPLSNDWYWLKEWLYKRFKYRMGDQIGYRLRHRLGYRLWDGLWVRLKDRLAWRQPKADLEAHDVG